MFRIIYYSLFFYFVATSLSAQVLEGRVSDPQGSPIQDAYLLVQNGRQHTHTDEFGRFRSESFQVGDTLQISFIGFATRSLVLEAADFEHSIDIRLDKAPVSLDQVVVSSRNQSLRQISRIDLQTNPVNSSQEVLRRVPGLFIAQHAGGGKAEQIFLRGFDIDHGTDINISVDGLPVNMVSHAHGQGYSDLHFLIPETIERIDFGKGPYHAEHGNFATAGYVAFRTKERLERSQATVEYGRFNTFRTVGLFDLLPAVDGQHAYLAGEYTLTDGPFTSSQNFNRVNLMGKYTVELPGNDKLSLLASHFESRWDASGQIPQRAVEAGLISRFGAIDDTEGGNTSRTNLALQHLRNIDGNSFVRSRAYYTRYDFTLYSNFTFFLNDPVNGDQIRQQEARSLFGLESIYHRYWRPAGVNIELQAGLGLRLDRINDNELSRTTNRQTIRERVALGDINESNLYGFVHTELDFGALSIQPALRLDYFRFHYVDQLAVAYSSLSEGKAFLSPKLNLIYQLNPNWQVFLKSGIGFHSNDTRVVVARSGEQILPAAYGFDLGTVWKPAPRLWFNAALWHLLLEQEFVYVGDEGIVEPSGRTRRSGIDLGLRFQAGDRLFMDADLNYTLARALAAPEGADFIPLAPALTATGGLSYRHPSGLSGGLRFRYIRDRPANEDGSITALGYFLTDLNANYTLNHTTFSLIIDNVLNTEWNEAQFATESRLQAEDTAVEELHFTPGAPIFIRAKVMLQF